MKILKVDKEKVQIELTKEEICHAEVALNCVELTPAQDQERQVELGRQFKKLKEEMLK